MKNGKRIAALALSMVVALGSVCYKPPKAEAVIFESAAVLPALLSTYLSGTGFSFSPGESNWDTDTANEIIATTLVEKYDAFCEYIKGDPAETREMLLSGSEFLENGIVKFTSPVAALLGQFSAWLIDKLGLIGEDGIPVTDSVEVVPGIPEGFVSYNGVVLPEILTGSYAYTCILAWYVKTDEPYYYSVINSQECIAYDSGSKKLSHQRLTFKQSNMMVAEGATTWAAFGPKQQGTILWDADTSLDVYAECVWSNYDILDEDGAFYFASSVPVDDSLVLSVTLPADYEAAPDVDEQYVMVIDTGMTFADEQAFIDSILGATASGELAPTYTIEQATTGDVVVPDEDEERVGILNWVKNIAQSVKGLPETIADAVANVFVPSEEYLAVLPETIASTFDGRTGILTYPTSVLYDFANRLSGGQQDFILSWPDVREPSTNGVMMEAGQFNVSKFVRDNRMLSDFYTIYQYAVGAYLTFLFLGLCSRKYNSIVGDSSGV